ncbi:MAG: hypothetical protein H6831_16035 [Planctomycetes bacterium]|nr:hypothetical protein [Planctomycetota bacterium]MCB9905910.1 hypothetical protein [Planctomycetota bacterium]
MTDGPRAFVLNLDAEHELEVGPRYTPTRHLAALVARQREKLVGTLLRPGDVLVTEEALDAGDAALERARGLPGIAWSPTPRALALLRRAGAVPLAAPSVEVLQSVNARPFAAEVRAPLIEGAFAKQVAATEHELLALVARPAPLGWLVRRTFGAAGRGRRRLFAGAPAADELAWIRASLRAGPLVVEPFVDVTVEYTRSGFVTAGGTVSISEPCHQAVAASGAWLRTERAERDAVTRADDAALEQAAVATGEALARAGYFGPFGIDAFRYRAEPGAPERLNPLSEINARLTMDWPTALALRHEFGLLRGRAEDSRGNP